MAQRQYWPLIFDLCLALNLNLSLSFLVRSQTKQGYCDWCWRKAGTLLEISQFGLLHIYIVSCMIDDMEVGCHQIYNQKEAIYSSKIENCVSSVDVCGCRQHLLSTHLTTLAIFLSLSYLPLRERLLYTNKVNISYSNIWHTQHPCNQGRHHN